ncbi:golgi protein 2, putative [Plasmodium chabaudi chabaudi]|uniref:Golgi protein 2, putative n=1 Tax=Plasmodium chabaudi chabaudi TaxID=31271 RepID=A0A4V0K6X1_PLACU|nr:golgi protein 2, putative [Plasmodium chabaudi chabaudi]VTZ68803.1 golgi protein 2, putative [Plasmodium chabaudi chabaudi]|eukprot:XP_736802.2 conserved Plasmodium protein, unknown function [Plasmodium chabaudi chabaudi]
MTLLIRCVLLYLLVLVCINCLNENNQSNNNDAKNNGVGGNQHGLDLSQIQSIVDSIKANSKDSSHQNSGNQPSNSNNNINVMDLINKLSHSNNDNNAKSGNALENLTKLLGNVGKKDGDQNANHGLESLTKLLGNVGKQDGNQQAGNGLENITKLLGNLGKTDGNQQAGNGLENITKLLGSLGKTDGNQQAGNGLENLTKLLGSLGKTDGNQQAGNGLENITKLLGSLGKQDGNQQAGNGLENLTKLLGSLGKTDGNSNEKNPLESLAKLFGNTGKNGGNEKAGNLLDGLASLLGNYGKKDGNENNKNPLHDLHSLFGNWLNDDSHKDAPFSLDNSVDHFSEKSKQAILSQYNHDERELLNQLESLVNKNKALTNIKEISEKNAKLRTHISTLKEKYNSYSYEGQLLNDMITEDDIKNKYNIDDNFENKIYEIAKKGIVYEEMSDSEKDKKNEMFEDINELDNKDAKDSGTINIHTIKHDQIENDSLLRGILHGGKDNLHECNCFSNKVKKCIYSYINYSNLEYMLGSLNINVDSMVTKYINDHTKDDHFKKSKSFLVPLPPLNAKSNIKNVNEYVLRVPRVLFLATKKSFSSSTDRYFFNLYDIMESQLKWNVYIWGYGFKYYPLFFTKNLHTLLHKYDHQIGREPFDIIFVHSSFISNYYNHYFFLKNMPKMTTLIFINDGWDSNVKKSYMNLIPHIFFQNQVNIFEYNPLNSIDIETEKHKLNNNIWNKVSNNSTHNVITNKHKKKKDIKKNSNNYSDDSTDSDNNELWNTDDDNINEHTLWAFLPHGINPCCSKQVDMCFELRSHENGHNTNSRFYYDIAQKVENKYRRSLKLSYSLLDLFVPECNFKNPPVGMFDINNRDIDILYLYNTTSSNYNDFLIQKIMDHIYNKNINNLKDRIHKYEVDTYYWKVWGLQTTHKLIKNKMKEYSDMLHRSKICIISSKFAGMLNKMVIDAMFSGCVVITDKSHNKDINKYIVLTQIPYEYYEIPDLVYHSENINSLSIDLIKKITTTLNEVYSGARDQMRIDAFKAVLNTYTYPGIILNWILPTLYFHHNKEKYEITNNYFVLPQYFKSIISKSLKTSSAKREKIIANIDLSLQEDLIMNNNEVLIWFIIWIIIFSVIFCYILKNNSLVTYLFKQRKLHL